jgi:hypothetical protein
VAFLIPPLQLPAWPDSWPVKGILIKLPSVLLVECPKLYSGGNVGGRAAVWSYRASMSKGPNAFKGLSFFVWLWGFHYIAHSGLKLTM